MKEKSILFFMALSLIFSCNSADTPLEDNNSIVVEEKITVESEVLKKTVAIEPKAHYRITVTNETESSDTLILKLMTPTGNVIGSNYNENARKYYSSFDVICQEDCGKEYFVEINSKNGNKIEGSWKMEVVQ